jgi:hypothetical protein
VTVRHNPALYEEPINQPLRTIPPIARESLIKWLERTGRFHAEDDGEFQDHKLSEDLDSILEPEPYTLEDEEQE